jgi:hypothetical protein
MKKTSKTLPSKLVLGRNTLRALTTADLAPVHGGWTMSGVPWCQVRTSGNVADTCGTGYDRG